ncbi:MAG: hypothetical protein U0164_16605 [Gemmatimonadaceae bacterium]
MTAPTDLLRPALADRFDLGEEIARRDGRIICEGRDTRSGERVWLHVIDASALKGVDLGRVRSALSRLTRVRHPWLVTPSEAGEDAGIVWFATRVPPGESLRARMTRDGALGVSDALTIARRAAQALQFAHEEKAGHGALDAASVYAARDGEVAVADVGIRRALSGEGSETGTTESRADQRALAALVYEVIGANQGGEGARTARAAIPADAETALQRALAPDDARLFPCMADFELALRPPAPKMPKRWSLATKVIGALMLAIILMISALGLWMVRRVTAPGYGGKASAGAPGARAPQQ